MAILSLILVLLSAVCIALLLRERAKLLHRIAELGPNCEQLKRELAFRDHEEAERIARLEHDLRSSISGIVGFSALLKESLEQDTTQQSPLLLKSANTIHQSATKTINILEAMASGQYDQHHGPQLALEGKR
jgi:signal transduction histidine kinase